MRFQESQLDVVLPVGRHKLDIAFPGLVKIFKLRLRTAGKHEIAAKRFAFETGPVINR
jgi:hypothetical protein